MQGTSSACNGGRRAPAHRHYALNLNPFMAGAVKPGAARAASNLMRQNSSDSQLSADVSDTDSDVAAAIVDPVVFLGCGGGKTIGAKNMSVLQLPDTYADQLQHFFENRLGETLQVQGLYRSLDEDEKTIVDVLEPKRYVATVTKDKQYKLTFAPGKGGYASYLQNRCSGWKVQGLILDKTDPITVIVSSEGVVGKQHADATAAAPADAAAAGEGDAERSSGAALLASDASKRPRHDSSAAGAAGAAAQPGLKKRKLEGSSREALKHRGTLEDSSDEEELDGLPGPADAGNKEDDKDYVVAKPPTGVTDDFAGCKPIL